MDHRQLRLTAGESDAAPIRIGFRGQAHRLAPFESLQFSLEEPASGVERGA